MSAEDGAEELSDEETYPPWLEPIVNPKEDYYSWVTVREEDPDDSSNPGFIKCKEVVAPDMADAAAGHPESKMRFYSLKRFTPVLMVAEPTEPPYIGLVDVIWRKADATPRAPGCNQYSTGDVFLECYWFYRPAEVPAEAAKRVPRPAMRGGRYRAPSQPSAVKEERSDRQLLFSSHHTQHDHSPTGLSMEGFLQTCRVHWLGRTSKLPERWSIHGGRLVRAYEPGFVVRGFLWCGAKGGYQLAKEYKEEYELGDDWGDKATRRIAKHMVQQYAADAAGISRRNQRIKNKYAAAAQQRVHGAVAAIESDDEDVLQQPGATQPPQPPPQQQRLRQVQQQHRQQQQQQQQQSPRLPGTGDDGGDAAAAGWQAPLGQRQSGGAFGSDDDDD